MHYAKFAVLLYGAVMIAPAALAQALDPADAAAPARPSIYRSTLESYTPYKDTTPGDWRAVNDEVARVGGHMGIFATGARTEQPSGKPDGAQPGEHAGGHHAK